MRRRVIVLVALGALLVAVGSIGPGEPRPKLNVPMAPMAPFGLAMRDAPQGLPYTLGGPVLCVETPGRAVVTRVAIHNPRGTGILRIDAFAIRQKAAGAPFLGDTHSPLASVGGGFVVKGAQTVSEVCSSFKGGGPKMMSELGLQISRQWGDVAGGPGLDISYEAGGTPGTLTLPFALYLCASECPDWIRD